MNKIYGNTPPFLGAKNVSTGKGIEETDVLIYGVPWEGAVTWGDYTGCELGPKVIRLSSARYSGYLPELNHIDVFGHLSLGDMGDVDVVPASVEETMERIETFSKRVWEENKFPVAFGGDHGITYPIMKALTETQQGKKFGIIHLDAHYDNMVSHEGDEFARSTPFARIYELDGIRNESIIHTGIHGPRNKPESGQYAKEAGAETVTIRDIRECTNIKELAEDVYKKASHNVDGVYLTICSDVLDYAFNPGGPVDGNGLTSYELLTLVHEFAKRGIVGMDFVEVYPQQDPSQFSAHFVSTVVLYALAGKIEGES
ncbi:agmatinase family protein [Priestia endophytica]|jgi:agmatinase|uniref:Agmatinase n=2 Tax=Priestia endophytica TaxID=135735 RepID=A0AAX1Q5F3_9BACI|nr:agmatinase family protein [Priestia endophytica]KYG27966.1 agmatinase [Priestia endophytica]MBG9814016.1 agmatinase [Priestia endophytica]MCM3537556.1 agmatinase family protein [Priestia endophytica]RAS73428.1 agmatinase [Priestia endophytica]RAS79078.1 agmatinase [Priestia endophytica]